MIRLRDTIAQLAPLKETAGLVKFIGGIGSQPELLDQMKASPSIFVQPIGLTATPNEVSTGAIRQTVITSIPLLLGFNRIGDRWLDQSGVIENVIEATIEQMLGWTLDPALYSPAELASSMPMDNDMKAGTFLHGIIFHSRNHLRKP
jgi:hypothetical protein